MGGMQNPWLPSREHLAMLAVADLNIDIFSPDICALIAGDSWNAALAGAAVTGGGVATLMAKKLSIKLVAIVFPLRPCGFFNVFSTMVIMPGPKFPSTPGD